MKTKIIIAGTLVLALFVSANLIVAYADDLNFEHQKTMYALKDSNVMKYSSDSSEKVVSVVKNEAVNVLGYNINKNWYKVSILDQTGYIKIDVLTDVQPKYTVTNTYGKYMYVKKNVNFRSSYSSSSKKIGVLIPKEKIQTIAKVDNKPWYRVKYNKKNGYVHANYLTTKKPVFTLKQQNQTMYCIRTASVRKGPSTNYSRIKTVTPHEKLKITAKVIDKNWYQVKVDNKIGYVHKNYITSKKPKFTLTKIDKTRYSTDSLNIRKGPGTGYSKLYTIKKNTKLKLTGDVHNSKWYRVQYNNKTGYVHGDYLAKSKINYTIIGRYSDETSKITLRKEWYQDAWVYAAHIEFSNYKRLKSTNASGGYETTSSVASRKDAILAVNGPYMGSEYAVARNGKVINDKRIVSDLAIYNSKNGILAMAEDLGLTGEYISTAVNNKKATDTFKFYNSTLVRNWDNVANPDNWDRAQRTFIGTNGKSGDIWICVSDGRYNDGSSAGLRKYQCANYLKKVGCKYGVMLDGGGSSTMVFKGRTINSARGNERAVKDFLYFR